MVVVKIRSSLLSVVLKITSSRQSPNRSALRAGVAFVPLFDEQSAAVMMVFSVPLCQSHFEMRLPSRISRTKSPSHQIAKLTDRGAGPILSPLQVFKPSDPPHISSPR